jgi:hypothetical protein
MPQYLYQLAYTSESLAAQIKNPEDRLELVGKQLVDAVGAHIVGSGYSFGEHDVSTPSRPACGSPIWHASKPTTSGSPQDRLSGRFRDQLSAHQLEWTRVGARVLVLSVRTWFVLTPVLKFSSLPSILLV